MQKYFYAVAAFIGVFSLATQAHALTVSPVKIDLRGDPGQTLQGEIELVNEQLGNRTFYTSEENFESKGDSGAPYFTGNKDGFATWITVNKQLDIVNQEHVKVPYTVKIPSNATPGGYFAAIFFGSEPPKADGGGQVTIGGKMGVLLLLRVNGDIKESAGLSSFGTNGSHRFFTTTPIDFEYLFNNTGGDRVVPKGVIVVENTFRAKTTSLVANDREGSVLPNSSRRFTVTWSDAVTQLDEKGNPQYVGFLEMVKREWNDFHFGWYTATINLSWGESTQTAYASYNFFVFPWQLLSVVLVLVLIVRFMLGRYKQSIIKSAQAQK